jgi:hypothetical protein
MPALAIKLRKLGPVRGIYGINGNSFPARAAFMHPEAAAAFTELERTAGPFSYSDILRGADESLQACKTGRGSQPPGYSGHNFGISFDIAVDKVLKEKRWGYEKLCTTLEDRGFYPYRQDHSRGNEEWHFNFLGPHAEDIVRRTSVRNLWQRAAEEVIQSYYPKITPMGAVDIQQALQKLGLYSGEIDGNLGPLSFTAINLFNQTWSISPNAIGERFQRTLAFVAADKVIDVPAAVA